jgi:hypothetical protein
MRGSLHKFKKKKKKTLKGQNFDKIIELENADDMHI